MSTSGGLGALEDALRRDLELLDFPKRPWVLPRSTADGRRVLDVLIIGGGQGGLSIAFGLQRERVDNLLVVDESPIDREGPWRTFARMITLRTPKHVTGPDWGIPSLTIRAWYEAQHGAGSWQRMGLIPKETWAEYLAWYRRFHAIPVRNRTRAGAIAWRDADRCFAVPVTDLDTGVSDVLLARKVVLATGIDGSGRWDVPDAVRALPPALWSHTRGDIDFAALAGKRVAVLGAGASAFDNASVALEAGAAEVRLFFRRRELVRVNPYRWAEFVGFLKHHGDLPDEWRWRIVRQLLWMGQLPPADTYARATKSPAFHLHAGAPWQAVDAIDGGRAVCITTPGGSHQADFLVIGTGFTTDLSLRPELANLHGDIALWRDRYQPPPGEASDDLARHPYLGRGFELTEKVAGRAPWITGIFNYTFGCLPSLGFGGASISGLKYSLPRIVAGITHQLYQDDVAQHFASLCAYDSPEF
jgi:cation diffusion facilitator CzcD-associated flavoprotein CzcO